QRCPDHEAERHGEEHAVATDVVQNLLGPRPVLAPSGRSAPPMPPDPVGRLERSRARPPPNVYLGARPVLGRFAPCALPMPPDPVGRLERSRARPPPHVYLGPRPVLGRSAPRALPPPPAPVRPPPRP